MRHRSLVLTILAVAVLHGACEGGGAELCPQYVVQPGDTPESIAAAAALDLGDLVAAIQACGGAVDALTPGAAVCLPGGEQPGCARVRPLGDRPPCKIYATQPGDTLSSVAASLGLFEPDLEGANPDIPAASLREGDLLKLPGWDARACGALPATLEELNGAPAPAPAPAAPPPLPDAAAVARGPGAAPKADLSQCRAFRARFEDDLYTIAALFAVDAVDLIAVNPDLAAGIPLLAGSVLRIPPYSPACPYPLLVDAAQAAAAPAPAPAPAPLPAPRPAAAPPVRVTDAVALRRSAPSVEFAAVSADLGGAEGTVADQKPQISNTVFDGGYSNAPPAPPPEGQDNTGAVIMAVCVGTVVLAVLAMLAWAVANSKARMAAKTPGRQDSDTASSVAGYSASARSGSEIYV